MFGSEILEVAIGIIFVFLLVSIICTAIRETIESVLKTRAAFLEHGLRELLHDKTAVGLARTFYNHPFVYGLYAGDYEPLSAMGRPAGLTHGGVLPTYVPARTFALTLLDIAARGPMNAVGSSDGRSPVLSLANVRAGLANLECAPVQRILLTAIDTAQGDLEKAITHISEWYNSSMDRVSGAYKRSTQKILFVMGFIVAVALNVNPLSIADYLYRNDAARKAVVARAEAAAKDPDYLKRDSTHSYAAARAELDSLRIPIGWPTVESGNASSSIPSLILGWLVVAVAATVGAPFWFDMLNKVMVVRSTVKPHQKSPEESSADKQNQPEPNEDAQEGPSNGGAVVVVSNQAPAVVSASIRAPADAWNPDADADADVDGCDVDASDGSFAPDDELPEAKGGVA